MVDLYDIDDHMAFSCQCGCVRFNLLRSGNIECSDCGEKQTNIKWGEIMDLNKEIEPAQKLNAEKAKSVIINAINKNAQCFWPEIIKESDNEVSPEELLQASRVLQKDGLIRLKEDSSEHAMEYILK